MVKGSKFVSMGVIKRAKDYGGASQPDIDTTTTSYGNNNK